ncbi:MAG: amidase family protein [Acidobacteriota bacterium]
MRAGDLEAEDVASRVEAAFEAARDSPEGPWRRAFVRTHLEALGRRAKALDRRRASGQRLGRLAGVPVAIKDNLSLEGAPLGCGSLALRGFTASFSATAVERLLDADAMLVGQTCLDEFAMGSSGERSQEPAPPNPWRHDRVPGGSSSGSAVAVALGLPLALGSDTGGSVRLPAALCGVVGLRPTYGRVSRRGLVGFASSLDQIGPLARRVEDVALALEVIAGHDPADATSSRRPVGDLIGALGDGLEGWRVAVPGEIAAEPLEDAARGQWLLDLERLRALGAEPVEVSIPSWRHAVAAYSVLACAEASSNLARFDGVRYGLSAAAPTVRRFNAHSRLAGLGPEVTRRLMLGTFALSASPADPDFLRRARHLRRRLGREIGQALDRADVLVAPTALGGAWPREARPRDALSDLGQSGGPFADALTAPASLAGLPSLSVPTGFDDEGLPLSLQVVGPAFREDRVLRAGAALENACGFPTSRPDASTAVEERPPS